MSAGQLSRRTLLRTAGLCAASATAVVAAASPAAAAVGEAGPGGRRAPVIAVVGDSTASV